MENRYVILGIGLILAVGQMMAPIPLWIGIPLLAFGLWFIAWGILGKPFQNKVSTFARPVYKAMDGFDAILHRVSSHENIAAGGRAELRIQFDDMPPYIIQSGSFYYCRFLVRNNGPAPAENVRVWLDAVEPPVSLPVGYYPPHYPSAVRRISQVDAVELQMNKDEEIWFEPMQGWLEAGAIVVQQLGSIIGEIRPNPGDRWKVSFSVQAANADEITLSMSVRFSADGISATIIR